MTYIDNPKVAKVGSYIDVPALAKLSLLEIDANKNWGGYRIENVGAPTTSGHAFRLGDVITDAMHGDKTTIPEAHHAILTLSKRYIPTGETDKVKDKQVFMFVTAHDEELYGDGILESEGDGRATGFDLGG